MWRYVSLGFASIAATALLTLSVPTFGQAPPATPNPGADTSGHGAVLCIWAIYLSIRGESKACGLERQPIDDAIDDAIVAIDKFIVANSSQHPTQETLDAFKRRAEQSDLNAVQRLGREKICEGPDLKHFRSMDPAEVRAKLKDLLSVPREPVMNPCL